VNSLIRVNATLAAVLAACALASMVGLLLYLCGGTLDTSDLWWHLKMGEAYATQGPWPAGDPLLHTAHDQAPVQHEWLFGVALHAVDRIFGFPGLRAAHVLAIVAILWLVHSIFRRESASWIDAGLATCVFVVLSWWRLYQIRPDLVSIPATFLVYRLLLEARTPPSWRRIGAFVALMVVWANAHSLFAIGLILPAIAVLGLALRASMRRWSSSRGDSQETASEPEVKFARRLTAALGLALFATLLNPRGIHQHLTFFTSSREAAIWAISDEWTHFNPFVWAGYGDAVSLPAWWAANAVGACFLLAATLCLVRFLRRPSEENRQASDPVLFGLGLASLAATLVSVRFLWMLGFPLLLLLRVRRLGLPSSPFVAVPFAWLLAGLSVLLAVAFPQIAGFRVRLEGLPSSVPGYLSTHYNENKFFTNAVRFLEETGVEGNLFNVYPMGGFLGYWLAPRLRTFVDGRTEHYAIQVLDDYFMVIAMRGPGPGESFLDILERRGVDIFVGTGMPTPVAGKRYTSAHLERAPGWILVSRSMRHGIYLRGNERNRENLRRITAYYQEQGVPFDPREGLDVSAVIRTRPDWAAAHGMVPENYLASLDERQSRSSTVRFRALQTLGVTYALVGAYSDQIEIDREAKTLRPRARQPRLRLVYGLLRLDRADEALAEARALYAIDPRDSRSALFLKVAREYARRRALLEKRDDGEPTEPLDALINRLPLV
jgi:hypothetical protein